ncbi:hypothetical protein [Candidatus Mesenet endosymbiont of Agriotes lineatus]|uniref:hypothetical protein n=1 Tax=Candidatus Mesenet endosymbiont of Agriotes lineatus TaxID=3077948 RepID=UPI0030CB02D4
MTGIQATDKKKKADDELQVVVDELKAIDENLNVRFDNIKKVFVIKRLIMRLFTSYSLKKFEEQIKSYKIVFEEISDIITKNKKESSSEIVSKLIEVNLSVEFKDEKIKARIERSNTLKELHSSTGKSAAELKLIINDCRKNTVEEHNRELSSQLTASLDKNKELEKEKAELITQIQAKDKQIHTQDQQIQAKDRQIQELLNRDKKREAEHQILAQQMSDIQRMLATMMSQNSGFKQFNNPNSPSSSLSDSDIEIIDMPSKKHS